MLLQGTLLDLVPHGSDFEAHAIEWINGPMREWWGMDGLMTQSAHERWLQRNREQPDAERQQYIRVGLRTKDGVPIGSFALMRINQHSRYAEVGAGIGDPN